MRLAQALTLRKSQNQMLNNLMAQITSNAYSSDKDDDPNELMAKYIALINSQMELIQRINRTNVATKLPDGMTLADARVTRDMLVEASSKMMPLSILRRKSRDYDDDGDKAQTLVLDKKQAKRVADDFARAARELDDLIQAANWNTDLL